MTSTHWDLVYGRAPLSRDVLLFGVAVALHLPLFLMQFKGVVRSKGSDPSFVEIKVRDLAIERVLQRGMILPSDIPAVVVKPVNLSGLIRAHAVLPALPAPTREIHLGKLATPPPVLSPKLTPALPLGPGDVPTMVKGDKGTFTMTAGVIQSVNPGIPLAVNKTQPIHIPTASFAHAESGIKSPTPLTSKILLAPLSTDGPVAPKIALKVDGHAGTAITGMNKPVDVSEEEVPVIRAQARTLTAEQRQKELFPIHGALKDRPVDRQEIPEYPEWARKKGIESSVQFRFSVTADGRVKDTIEIVKGSGYPELDQLARTALLRWVFSRLPPEKGNLVQDGVIEFRFSIK